MSRCPDHQRLLRFVRGEMPVAEIDAMGDHLEDCGSCTGLVEELEQRTDSFIAGLQQAHVGCSSHLLDATIHIVDRQPQREQRIHCPHCHNPMAIVERLSIAEVTCPTCHGTFEVTDDRMGGAPYTHPGRLGNYVLIQRVGVGAVGAVWRAKDNTLDRIVAIKIPRLGTHRSTASQQFLREARAAAQLQHPNIVNVHAVEVERDTTYIVSDFIHGATLASRIASRTFSYREAAELCAKVAAALHHAHESGVVHRDLKPSNIMVDAADEPHIMDFGLAKRHAGEITVTVEGRILGTPAYMSPEQAKGNAHTADGRSDIYSLGVTLFELLTGERPFRGATRILLEQVLFEEPPSPRRLDNSIPRDLETICLKCLEKHVDRRYQTAADLCDDLQRFLSGHPVQASRTSGLARTMRWCKRRPFRAALVGVAMMLAIMGPLLAVYERQLRSQAESARLLSEVNERRANAERLTAQARQDTRRYPQRSLLLLLEALTTTAVDAYRVPEAEQTLRDLVGSVGGRPMDGFSEVITSPDSHWLLARDAVGFICIWDLSSKTPLSDEPVRFPGVLDHVPLVISPDSRWLVHDGPNDCLQMRDLGRQGFPVTTSFDKSVRHVQFSPNSQWLAAGTKAGPIRLFQLLTDRDFQFAKEVPCDAGFFSRTASFSPDSRWLTSCTRDEVTLHALPPTIHADVHLRRRSGETVMRCETGPNTKVVAVNVRLEGIDSGTGIRLWKLNDERQPITSKLLPDAAGKSKFSADERWLVQNGRLLSLADDEFQVLDYRCDQYAMSPNGKLLAIAVGEVARLWDLTSEHPLESEVVLPLAHEARINHLTFSSDSRWLATASLDASVRIWDITNNSSSQRPFILRGQEVSAIDSSFSSDSRWIITNGNNHARLWPFSNGDLHVSRDLLRGYNGSSFALSSDKRWFAVGAKNHVNVYDLTSDDPKESVQVLRGHAARVESTSFSDNGSLLVSGAVDGDVRLWSCDGMGTFAFQTAVDHAQGDRLATVAICPHGRWIVSMGHRDGQVVLHDLSRSLRLRWEYDGTVPDAVHFSSDGRWMLSGGEDCLPELWDLSQDRPTETVRRLPDHKKGLGIAVFDERNQRLFTSGSRSPSPCFIWNLASKKFAASRDRLDNGSDFQLSKDRHWLARAHADGIGLYNATTSLHEQTPFSLHHRRPCFAFSSRGHLLAVGSRDLGSQIEIWSVARDDPNKILDLQFSDPILSMQFSIDGRWLLVGSIDQATLWDLRSPEGPVTLRAGNQYENLWALHANRRWALAASHDAIWLWDVQLETVMRKAQRLAGRELTDAEREAYRLSQPIESARR